MRVFVFNTVLVALTIILVLVVAGYQRWPFIFSVLIGALAQTIFRLVKRYYSYKASNDQAVDLIVNKGKGIDTLTIQVIGAIYFTMILVSVLWYGAGVALESIIEFFA